MRFPITPSLVRLLVDEPATKGRRADFREQRVLRTLETLFATDASADARARATDPTGPAAPTTAPEVRQA